MPGCSDAEVITIVLVRHLLRRRSESGFLAEVRRDDVVLFPRLAPPQRVQPAGPPALGAFERVRGALADLLLSGGVGEDDDWGQVDTSALPVKHPSRLSGPDSWTGPNGLCARFVRDAAYGEWFYRFRLAARTDLGSLVVRAWAIVPQRSTSVTWCRA